MKRCPECRRDYYDDSLLYCLDDGSALLEGPASGGGSTAVLEEHVAGDQAGNAQTKVFGAKPSTPGLPRSTDDAKNNSSRPMFMVAVIIMAIMIAGGGY